MVRELGAVRKRQWGGCLGMGGEQGSGRGRWQGVPRGDGEAAGGSWWGLSQG